MKAETIFDYDVTPEEIEELALYSHTLEDYMESYTKGGALSDLSSLFFLRGDDEKGSQYAKLANKEPIMGFGDYLPGLE